ncbi:MAG: leucine-rich repeat domain-containing protein [Clostridiales bacterium]|nr:leucine-rich repeat domain-containing protein [Clostridiales bacterium]
MRKKIAAVLALTMGLMGVLGFAACGEAEDENPTSKPEKPAPETEIKGETLADEAAWQQAIADTEAKTNATLTYTATMEERMGEYFMIEEGTATAKVADGKLHQIATGTMSGYYPNEDDGEMISYQDKPFTTEMYVGFIDGVAMGWWRENQEEWDCSPYGEEITATVGGVFSTIDVSLALFFETYADFQNVDGTYVLEGLGGNDSSKVELKFVDGLLYSYVMEVAETITGEEGTSTESIKFSITITYDGATVGELPPISVCSHSFTDYIPNDDATCTEDGTKTAECDYGCGETDTVADEGTKLGHNFEEGTCSVCGAPVPSEGLAFSLSGNGEYYILTGMGTCSGGKVVIPDEVDGIPVTKIQHQAFLNDARLTEIVIPDSVTFIDEAAFGNCVNLTSVTLGNGIITIADNAFSTCSALTDVYITDLAAWFNIYFVSGKSNPVNYAKNWYLDGELITQLYIPDGVTEIHDYALYGGDFTEVVIPESVTKIGNYAFYWCDSLEKINIPNSVTSIGKSAFENCTALKEITIPASVATIRERAFSYCNNLTIYCEAGSKPSGWDASWNKSERPVLWGEGTK